MTDTPKTPPNVPTHPNQPTPTTKEPPYTIAARTLQADVSGRVPPSQLLYNQAALLDALFAQLLHDSFKTKHTLSGKAYRHVEEGQINMALRAQKQCRQTLDAVALRMPPQKTGNQTESPS